MMEGLAMLLLPLLHCYLFGVTSAQSGDNDDIRIPLAVFIPICVVVGLMLLIGLGICLCLCHLASERYKTLKNR